MYWIQRNLHMVIHKWRAYVGTLCQLPSLMEKGTQPEMFPRPRSYPRQTCPSLIYQGTCMEYNKQHCYRSDARHVTPEFKGWFDKSFHETNTWMETKSAWLILAMYRTRPDCSFVLRSNSRISLKERDHRSGTHMTLIKNGGEMSSLEQACANELVPEIIALAKRRFFFFLLVIKICLKNCSETSIQTRTKY